MGRKGFELTWENTQLLRGVAILCIILHNFCHLLPQSITENEYGFSARYIHQYVEYIRQGGPHLLLNLFSHFGHYGVPLFVFLSGYGLVRKYERPDAPYSFSAKGTASFLWKHALKLWSIMLYALVLYIMLQYLCDGHSFYVIFRDRWKVFLYLITFQTNLRMDAHYIHGPWWFFSLMMQLYLFYAFVLRRRGKTDNLGLFATLAAGVLLQWIAIACPIRLSANMTLLTYMRYNFVGSLLPFALGVAAGRMGLPDLKWWHSIIGAVLLWFSAYDIYFWTLSPIFALCLMLPVAKIGQGICSRVLCSVGGVSAWIFALHPLVRARVLDQARAGHEYWALAVYLLLSVSAAYLLTWLRKIMLRHIGSKS